MSSARSGVEIGYATARRRLDGDRFSVVIDVEDLPAPAGQNEEPLFLELRNECNVADMMARVIDSVFFLNDERDVKIVVRRRSSRRAGR